MHYTCTRYYFLLENQYPGTHKFWLRYANDSFIHFKSTYYVVQASLLRLLSCKIKTQVFLSIKVIYVYQNWKNSDKAS